VAAQTDGIAGAVVVGDVLEGESGGVAEGWESGGGHGLASFSAAGTTCDAGPSLRAVCEEVAGNRAMRIERRRDPTSMRGDP
jgi:hypothetical protein